MKLNLSALCLILSMGLLAPAHAQGLDPSGAWKWNVVNPDGAIPNITITLKLQGQTLTGSVTKPSGAAGITNGVFKDDKVSFQTVQERKNGNVTTTYSGKLSGDTIKGKVAIDVAGKNISSDMEMKREAAKP